MNELENSKKVVEEIDLNNNSDDENKRLFVNNKGLKQVQQRVFDSYNAALKEAKKNPEIKLEEAFRDQLKFDNKNITTKAFRALQNVFGDVAITDSNCSNILGSVSTGQAIAGIALQVGTCSRRRSTYQNHCDFNSLVQELEKEQIISEKLIQLKAGITNAHLRIFKAYNETIDELNADPKIRFTKLETNFSNRLDGDKYKEVFINCFRGLYATFGKTKISEENAQKISNKIGCNGKLFSILYASFTLNLGYSSWWNKDAFNKVLMLIERDIQREETKETAKKESFESRNDVPKSVRKNSMYDMNPFD